MKNRIKREAGTFKDNIRKMFITYSLVPAFVVACFGLIIFISVWRYTIVQYNQEDNQIITTQIESILSSYQKQMDIIDSELDLSRELTSEDKAVAFHHIYQSSKDTGCKGNLYLVDEDGTLLISATTELPDFIRKPEYQNWGIMRQLREGVAAGEMSEKAHAVTGGTVIDIAEDGRMLVLGKALYEEDKKVGYLLVTIESQEMESLLTSVSRQYMVTDERGWVIFRNYGSMQDTLGRVELDLQLHNGFVQYREHQYYMTCSPIQDNCLYVYTITDTEPRANMILLIVVIVLLIFLAIGLLTYFSADKIVERNTQDIDQLAGAFKQAQNGDFQTRLSIGSSQEFATIGNAYNMMIDSLKKQIAENKELAEHVAFAQVKQLESQFNPHFLFNTLDNIRFMTRIDVKQADSMIIALSKLLRYSIGDAREEITVSEDMENMQNYLTILKIRFNKRFTYDIDIEENVERCLIPKLMVQPLLENAVKYGFQGRENLHVHIRGYEKHDKLIFICKDDGTGINAHLLGEIRENLKNTQNATSHMGLYNIHRRIQILYKEDYGVKIQSEEGVGTTVVLVLPYRIQ